jgi:hypothetical protein
MFYKLISLRQHVKNMSNYLPTYVNIKWTFKHKNAPFVIGNAPGQLHWILANVCMSSSHTMILGFEIIEVDRGKYSKGWIKVVMVKLSNYQY